jgi:NAD(P)-dependent dehydrogenase (short-subunit alcohol dehydrogenase family)
MADLRYDDRVAVITGGGRGIGRAYAELLASRGARVVVNDPGVSLDGTGSDSAPADEVVRTIKRAGGEAVACVESIVTPKGGRAVIEAALDNYSRIDILIHNAGIVRRAPLAEMSYEDLEASLDVNLRGGFHVVRPAFPLMCQAGYGRIVLTASCSALYGNQRSANYAMGKMGTIGLANVAALEGLEHGVRCNVIVPAAVTRMAEGLDTSHYPPMDPDLVAPAVGWLAHESCDITGEMLIAVAGRIARAYVAETPGVYRPAWSIEQMAQDIGKIRTCDRPLVFPVSPCGQLDHLRFSFAMARGTAGR